MAPLTREAVSALPSRRGGAASRRARRRGPGGKGARDVRGGGGRGQGQDQGALEEEGVERLPGAHCYEVFAGRADFERLTHDEPATFFLTDFLVRNFERLVWLGLGLDRHPELLSAYFGNYRRVVYLAQTRDPLLQRAARQAAARLGLPFEYRLTGLDGLARAIRSVPGGVKRVRDARLLPVTV